jgi:hypothetical protein
MKVPRFEHGAVQVICYFARFQLEVPFAFIGFLGKVVPVVISVAGP